MSKALNYLCELLAEGWEWPDASAKAGAWIGEEIGFTDVIDIKCPALGLEIDGPAAKQAA